MSLPMRKWFEREMLRKLLRFIGPKAVQYLLLGVVAGLALSGIELLLAGSIQLFLVTIGLLSASAAQIPTWVPSFTLAQVLALLCFLGVARAFLQWVNIFLAGASLELQTLVQKQRLLRWAFRNQDTSGGQLNMLLGCASYSGLAMSSVQGISAPLVSALFLWGILFWTAPSLTIIVTICFFFVGLSLRQFDRKITDAAAVMAAANSRQSHLIFRSVKNLLLIHLYGMQEREMEAASKNAEDLADQVLTYQSLAAVKYALPQAIGVVMICGITYLAREGAGIPPVKLLSYFYIFNRFVQALAEMVRQGTSLKFYWPNLAILAKWWADHAEDGVRGVEKAKRGVPALRPLEAPVGWRLRGVSYSYPAAEQVVLQNIDLEVGPGEAIVIQGPSGVGKSTLLQLLLGSFAPTHGSLELLLGGGRVASLEMEKSALLQSVGYVGPESFLLEGSVRENLVYGLTREPTEAEIRDALRMAECQFVDDLPQGLLHRLTEQGQGLSAGQKQRLSLARALLRNPKVLVLDEATANLDFNTEAKLVTTLERLKGRMTIIIATHREALLRIADQKVSLGS